MPSKQDILIALLPMKMRARKENLLFHHKGISYEVCLTPEELDSENAVGAYIWGPGYWTLIPNNKRIIKETEMELRINWKQISNENLIYYRRYFVASITPNDVMKEFCIATRKPSGWKQSNGDTVDFKVTHVSLIEKLAHDFPFTSYAIGNKIEILETIDDYELYSIGEIVGKYDKMSTWAIRMEDNFVLLMKSKDFRHHYSGGGV